MYIIHRCASATGSHLIGLSNLMLMFICQVGTSDAEWSHYLAAVAEAKRQSRLAPTHQTHITVSTTVVAETQPQNAAKSVAIKVTYCPGVSCQTIEPSILLLLPRLYCGPNTTDTSHAGTFSWRYANGRGERVPSTGAWEAQRWR